MLILPVLINKEQAYSIIQSRKPEGQFFLKEGSKWVGIDNSNGVASTEEFETITEVMKWLKKLKDRTAMRPIKKHLINNISQKERKYT